jgi:hypothetical protein
MRLNRFVWAFCTLSALANTGLAGIAANPTASNARSPVANASASAASAPIPATSVHASSVPASSIPIIKLPTEGTLSIEIVRGPQYEEHSALSEHVKDLYKKKDFAAIDALAENLLSSKKTYWNGVWYLETLMHELQADGAGQQSTKEFEKYLETLNEWIKKSPNSQTPRAALIEAWIKYAWKARGSGYADSVTEEGWKQFGERLKKAAAVVEAAKGMHTPTLYTAEETLALGQSWDKKAFNKMFDEGIKYNPDYFDLYFRKVYFLLPRWNGSEGEFESFVDRAANKMGGDKGDIFYARMVNHFFSRRIEGDDVFKNTKLSWKRTKKGFELLLKQYPNSLDVESEYAKLATVADDEEIAKGMFEKIGNRCNKDTWTRGEFIKAKQKATSYKAGAKATRARNEDDEDAEPEK